MDKIDITSEQLRALLHYNKKTGVFTWRVDVSDSIKKGTLAGCLVAEGYVRIRVAGRLYYAHRLAVCYVTGLIPSGHVDHINHNRSDNRWKNIRDVTRSINLQNRRGPASHNTSGFLGVSPSGRINFPWVAQLRIDKKHIHIGRFKTPELAHAAYLYAKKVHHDCLQQDPREQTLLPTP